MIDIVDYITYDEVRTTAGLSTDELPDSLLALPIYASALELELDSVVLTSDPPGPGPLKTRYLQLEGLPSLTPDEQRLYNLTRMFCAYAVAVEVTTSLSMRAPRTLSDSKATLTRFSPESAYRDVIEALKLRLQSLKTSISAFGGGSSTNYTLIYAVKPSYDPITGESS